VRRKEDGRFLTGRGQFVADVDVPGALWCCFVRSPHAHARIRSMDPSRALNRPGVVAVLNGADMAAAGVASMKSLWRLPSADGALMAEPARWALARDSVRYVGEPVAVVVASSNQLAADAAEQVLVNYDVLPAAVDARFALSPGAPLIHADAPGNLCLHWLRGEAHRVDDAFQRAAHVVEAEMVQPRLAGAAIEPRALIAQWDALSASLTLWATTQVPHHIRGQVSEELGLSEGRVRVIAPDVGGGFGYKGKHYPEETVLAWAARTLDRCVRWTATRSESFLADLQGRGHSTRAALALDADARFLALRVETVADLGAYVSNFGAAIPTAIYGSLLAGPYGTPAILVSVRCAFTNQVPTDAYRGAGRPEACCVLERLADLAADAAGLDRAEIRRRNLIPPSAMPYRTPLGATYDCGDFPRLFERALVAASYGRFEARRAQSAARNRLRGLGLAMYVESSGVGPSRLSGAMGARVGYFESAEIRVDGSGGITALLGTHSHGQGHATTFSQILRTRLGVPLDRIDIIEGDTALVPAGAGTFGSRSIAVGGAALARAADRIIAKGRRIAAHLLEAAETDIAFHDGSFAVTGTDRRLRFAEVARVAARGHPLPPDVEPGLHEIACFDPVNFAWSNGCHVVELEIDPDTGRTELVSYVVVDDFGTLINPMIVHGQVHGGAAQGSGQALQEWVAVDADGQLLGASFMDYAVPRADDLPCFHAETDEGQPYPHNLTGAKGCGESGAVGAPAAIAAAVRHALTPLGVNDIAMPFTPARLWTAISAAQRRRA
jgi:aerobic carbon-monoxide dehydrogenase large subunit